MDNRINIKDIILIVLVCGVGLLVIMSMWMQDRRQWEKLEESLTAMKEQRESVDLYKRELAQLKREQDALRSGVEQMSTNVGQMTEGVKELVEVLQASAAEGVGPRLAEGAGENIGDGGPVEFSTKDFDDDPTFSRVAGLRDRPDFSEGDFFIDAFATTVKNLTPYVAGDIYASRISEYVLDSLLAIDPDTLEYKPWVAESWEVSEDGLTITYKMRKDVVFSDGHPMDANDVVFTYEWVMNPKVDAPRTRSYFEKFESVTALDDHTVQFKYREPYFMALTVTGGYLEILPEHWVSQFTEDEYNKTPGLLLGSGPYKLAIDPKRWQPGSQKIELVRNENYWGPRPALDKVIWREILEDTARLAEFRNREIDRFGVLPSMYRTLSGDAQLRNQADLYEYEYVSSGYSYVGWNQRKNGRDTPFTDQRVRQAMTLLIDRQAMASRIFDNLSTPASGPFHPLGWQADPDIKPWPYDPERAKQLLDAAGYIDRDGDGKRESEDGVPFVFEFIYSANSVETRDTALMMQESMRQAGIEMKLNPMDWPAMQQKLNDRTYDAIMLGWGGAVDSDLNQMFHSSQVEDGGNNYTYHVNAELDAKIEQARTTVDREKCTQLWNQVHALLYEQQPYTFMFNRKIVLYVDKRLENFDITNIGPNNAYEYYVPAPMQLHAD
ncbi:MAG: peptide-binding protein [Planctomycetota bacterium]